MILKRLAAVCVILSSMGLVAAEAQSLRSSDGPVNFPPASFTGKQFVDNRGCAFVRAGIDGRVNWVPRVSRSRKLLCGLKPTFSGANAQIATAAPARKPVQIVPDQVPAQTATAARPAPQAAPKPAPRVVQQPKPRAQPVQRTARVTPDATPTTRITRQPVQRQTQQRVQRITPQPVQRVQRIQPAPVQRVAPAQRKTVTVRQAAPQRVTRRSTCTNFTGISAQYAGSGAGVRCGSQTQGVAQGVTVTRQPTTVVRNGQRVTVQRRVAQPVAQAQVIQPRAATQGRVITRDRKTGNIPAAGNTRVVPKHVYNNNRAAAVTQKIPNGYRKAWDDDRLNTKRAHMTVNGIRQSDLVWTRTVPRKLYLKDTGRVVNHLFPKLRYPYTSMAQQNQALGLTTSSRSKQPAVQQRVQRTQPKPKAQAAGKGRYVQVGMFSSNANAQRAAQQIARAGLPARMGTLTKGGKTYRLVLAGPFAQNQLGSALNKARRAGFSDAYVR